MKREASHAGSWYSNSPTRLNRELDEYLQDVSSSAIPNARAIIAPHAGYRFSGPTAAFAYKLIDTTPFERVFILGPSHHVYLQACALSRCETYETPLGDLTLDREVINQLYETKQFQWMSLSTDEKEHSIEMHLPYTAKIFQSKLKDIKIVPILVGSIEDTQEKSYGELLAPYLNDPKNLFIISSDFCHWGLRFSYTYYRPRPDARGVRLSARDLQELPTPIHQSISDLDHQGMRLIEAQDHAGFTEYLEETSNTICGRHPIGVLMCALDALSQQGKVVKFTKYAQSSPCQKVQDSSVSYASGYVTIQ
ncbi:MEMO1 family [Syncephalastrum racemosum]|uniref:MEMO1 family n=1 Tax=Syncephalastrum racemosum TaxID=13706 RepID=A0A1X2HTL5_SYNRA|nr:MEMO1 family [Syncephalastrum racemosum]